MFNLSNGGHKLVTPILYLSTFLCLYVIKVFLQWETLILTALKKKKKPLFQSKEINNIKIKIGGNQFHW